MEGDAVMTYIDNIDEVVINIKKKLLKASDVSKLQRTIATYLLASNWERITNGIAVSGRSIGSYNSINPLYVNPNKAVRSFPKTGKYGESKFKNGKLHKTGYFAGYRQFRTKVGRNSSVVNLQMSGKLRRDWVTEQNGRDWVIGFRSEYGSEVSRGNEQHFNCQIFGVSQKERDQVFAIEKEFINDALKLNA